MKAVFRCDVGIEYGLGHVSRCLALADALAKAGAEAVFALWGDAPPSLQHAGFSVKLLASPRGPEHDRVLIELAAGADLLVSDSREVGTLAQARLREGLDRTPLVVIDERADRYILADAIVNPGAAAYLCRYEHSLNCKTVLGPAYALVRPDVASLVGAEIEPDGKKRIVVAMGAFDAAGLTRRMLEILDAFPEDFSVTALISEGAPSFAEAKKFAAVMKHEMIVMDETAEIGPLLTGATLGVCAGGCTAAELACLGVPAAYLTADAGRNEETVAFERAGAGMRLGPASETPDEIIATKLGLLLRHESARSAMSRNARQLIDGRGAQRVLAKLSKYGLLNLEIQQNSI